MILKSFNLNSSKYSFYTSGYENIPPVKTMLFLSLNWQSFIILLNYVLTILGMFLVLFSDLSRITFARSIL